MFTKTVTQPAAYPVTLTTVKEWLRVDSEDATQDTTLNLMIEACTKYAERKTGRAFVERTVETSFDCFDFCMELPLAPLLQVMSVSYTDASENAQEVDPAEYEVDTTSEPGRVRIRLGYAWPIIGITFNPVRIRYRAGYMPEGSPADLTDNSYLPAELRHWLHGRICTLYDNRDHFLANAGVMSKGEIPRDFADGLLDPLTLGTRIF